MKLPHPRERLAGCCWLPRLAAKTRAYLRGEMPLSYRLAFGSAIGVDGYFLRQFRLTRRQVVAAVKSAPDNDALARWFTSLPSVNPMTIEAWNRYAPKLGARNHPGHVTLGIVKYVFYPKSVARPVNSIFEAIIQDENLEEPGQLAE